MANITWTKLRNGSWGLRATEALVEGASVSVSRANGSTSQVAVGKLIWQGNGVFLYSTGPKPTTDATAPKAASKPAPRRNWRPCGYPGCNPSYCDECDGRGAAGRYDW